jgi:hypothetical protein
MSTLPIPDRTLSSFAKDKNLPALPRCCNQPSAPITASTFPLLKSTSHNDMFEMFTYDFNSDLAKSFDSYTNGDAFVEPPTKIAQLSNSFFTNSDQTMFNDASECHDNRYKCSFDEEVNCFDPKVLQHSFNLPKQSKVSESIPLNYFEPSMTALCPFTEDGFFPMLFSNDKNTHNNPLKESSEYTSTDLQKPIIRRKTKEGSVACSTCNTDIGVVQIRGSKPGLQDEVVLAQICCAACEKQHFTEEEDEKLLNSLIDPRNHWSRKRKRRDENLISCEVCKQNMGVKYSEHKTENVKVEYICLCCFDKYLFCSECGGGGKQRTGKWRPKELFGTGRKTCSLPHIRVGSAAIHYEAVKISQITTEHLVGIQDVFYDCYLSQLCVPSTMETDRYSSYYNLKSEMEDLWDKTVANVLNDVKPHTEKYLTFAWIERRNRNKALPKQGKASQGIASKKVNWLAALNVKNLVNENFPESSRCFVAFTICEWDFQNRTIFVSQMSPRSVFLKTIDGYMELLKRTVIQVQLDAQLYYAPEPQYIWCWANSDHSRLASLPQRLKFTPKSQFLEKNESVDPHIFDQTGFEYLKDDRVTIYVSKTTEIIDAE